MVAPLFIQQRGYLNIKRTEKNIKIATAFKHNAVTINILKNPYVVNRNQQENISIVRSNLEHKHNWPEKHILRHCVKLCCHPEWMQRVSAMQRGQTAQFSSFKWIVSGTKVICVMSLFICLLFFNAIFDCEMWNVCKSDKPTMFSTVKRA